MAGRTCLKRGRRTRRQRRWRVRRGVPCRGGRCVVALILWQKHAAAGRGLGILLVAVLRLPIQHLWCLSHSG